jgi:hypothetical protein
MLTKVFMQDLINFFFGVFGALLAYQNIREAKKHNKIQGVHWYSTFFFSSWGIWNIYFYSSLELYLSVLGSICIVLVDFYWLYLYYKLKKGELL